MKKARANDVQQWQRQQPPSSMPSMHQQPQAQFANQHAWYSNAHPYQTDMSRRPDQQMDFRYAAPPQPQAQPQHHQQAAVQPPMAHAPPPQAPPQQQQQQTPTPAPAPAPRQRKRAAPASAPPPPQPAAPSQAQAPPPPQAPATPAAPPAPVSAPSASASAPAAQPVADDASSTPIPPPSKKSRTNTPWTPAEELRLKQMRDQGNSWAEIAKTFPTRTEGSVKKHWYKDMHYAEFAEDESQALLNAIKEYENNKWKVIGQKVGKPAKACEQYAKEHFPGMKDSASTPRPSKNKN